jgi:uncharacterized protein
MKIILLIASLLFASPALASDIQFPALTGRVVDTADQIPVDLERLLDAEITDFEKSTGHQFVVITIPDLHGIPKEDYTLQLGRQWGIGRAGADDGIILLQSPGDGSPGSGKIRIEVGKGMEYILTDAETGRIIRDLMVPILKSDRPRAETTPQAILAGAREIMRLGAITPEQKAEFDAKIAAEDARRRRATMDAIGNFFAFALGLGTVGAGGWGIWMFATRQKRAERRTARAEAERIAAAEAARHRQLREDQERRQAEARRQQALREQQARQDMLNAMTPERRAAFLAEEEAQRQAEFRRIAAESDRRRQAEEAQRKLHQEEAEDARRSSNNYGSSFGGSSETPSNDSSSFSGGGGDFGGGGAGGDY